MEHLTGDLELMRLAREGAREAFAALVRRHQRSLVAFFLRMGSDAAAAEDCAQETFLRLYRSLGTYSPLSPFRAFLYTIARNVGIDWLRRGRRTATAPEALAEDVEDTGGGDADAHLDLRSSLTALPERLRLVVVLSIDEGLSTAEIASVLGIPRGTVKSRMFHAVRRLREALHADLLR